MKEPKGLTGLNRLRRQKNGNSKERKMKQKTSKIKRMSRNDRKIVVRVNYHKLEIRVK